MNESQAVEIPLSEYLELKKLEQHKKQVRLEEKYVVKDGTKTHVGTSIIWKSDGKCWMYLADKIKSYSIQYENLYTKYEELKNMSIKEFKKKLDRKW